MIKIRRQSLRNLSEEYSRLQTEAETYKVMYQKSSPSEVNSRLRAAKEMLHKYAKVDEVMIEIIERFSPNVAKELKFKLENHMKNVETQLNKDYSRLPEFKHMPESSINNVVNSTIDILVRSNELHRQLANLVFIAVTDAIKRSGKTPPVELDEYLKGKLQELNPEYALLYEGAWQALESTNPEKYIHCAVSNRRLVHLLVGERSPERKSKLQSTLKSETEAELASSLADTVDCIHNVLSKGVHYRIDFEAALLSLRITEHLLRFILERGYESSKTHRGA